MPGAADGRGGARVLVLVVIDGLGERFLNEFGAGGALLAHRRRRLTSVFPSTTAAAVTTLMSGLAPATHGLTGWFIRDTRLGGVIAPLPLHRRGGRALRAPFLVPRLFPYPSMFAGACRPAVLVSPHDIAHSAYSRRHGRGARIRPYRGLAQFAQAIDDEVHGLLPQGGYVHGYYARFDAISHRYGSRSAEAVAEFRRLDEWFGDLVERLSAVDCTVLLTADHGFVDAPPERLIALERLPGAAAMLAAPLFGERRTAFCAVRAGAEAEFAALVRDELAGRAVVHASAQLVRAGLFGPGPAHKRLLERAGTHTLLMEPGWTIADRVAGEPAVSMLGVHGGLSADEMWVPLVQAGR